MCWLLLLLTLVHSQCLVFGQHPDAVNSCNRVKTQVFEEKVAYSFLFPNAPITYEAIDNCHRYSPLIVGGQPADPKEFPLMARLGHRQQQQIDWFCGGTLISENFVLTAAHCLESEQGEVDVVRLGDLDFGTDKDDALHKDYAVSSYFSHPRFTSSELYNDIGLVKLAENVKFDRYKHPACLPFDDGQNVESFIAVGWGSTSLAGRSSAMLLKVKLDRIADTICNKVIEYSDEYPHGFDAASQMCVGSTMAKDTCNGDSGGPILVYHEQYTCMYHVMGVTSTGISCGTPKIPSIYMRVHYYLDWIRSVILNN